MLSFTTNQLVVLVLVLVLGWLLGLASRSGGAKYRRQAEAERARAEAAEARIEAANARIAELERHAPPVGAATAGSIAAAARGGRDDLSLIRGIGQRGELLLNEAGIHRYRQIADLSDHDAAALEGRLGATPGTIERGNWREQAAMLASGDRDEHGRRWPAA